LIAVNHGLGKEKERMTTWRLSKARRKPRDGVVGRSAVDWLVLFAVLAALLAYCQAGFSQVPHADSAPLPELRKVGRVKQLFVGDKPFLVLGGELGNSTASDLAVLDVALEKCQRMNLNTVMLPVYWDLIEPEEGKFDFTLVKGAIDRARARDLRLVFLWFGTWKNSMSCYAPSWVKRDTARFERAKSSAGEALEIISPESAAANAADARAFAALMRWTSQYDAHERTVVMVQVENEVGMIPEPRDHSEKSEQAYRSEVPDKLLSLLAMGELGPEVGALWKKAGRKSRGTWSEVFGAGPEGEEILTAWQLSRYVEKVAAAGKREYPLPMIANAALVRPGYQPGQYPSAGPLPHLLEVWRAGAPSLDMICPDIYFPNFMEWCGRYVRNNNPLFIPEMAPSLRATGNVVYAVAQCGAIGCGPFAIESVDPRKQRRIANCYGILGGMSGLILKAQQDGTILGLSPQVAFDWTIDEKPQRGELGSIVFEATFDRPASAGGTETTTLPTLGSGRWDVPQGTPCGSAMIMQIADEEFVIVGMGVTITFAPANGKGKVGIDRVQEGRYKKDGKWVGGRWLNGDETHQGRHVHFDDGRWTVQRVTLYRY
jgi:beta-galactosidase GanA